MRTVRIIGGVLVLGILFAACGSKPPRLKPEEVLRRTVIAGRMLDSVAIAGSGSFVVGTAASAMSVSLRTDGVIHGAAWSLNVRTTITGGNKTNALTCTLASPGNNVQYLRIDSFAGTQSDVVQKLLSGSITSEWRVLSGDPSSPSANVVTTPATQDISAFVSMLRILKDQSLQRSEDGDQYHYTITTTSPTVFGKDATVNGEVWIDDKTFYLKRAIWHFEGVKTPAGPIKGTIMVNLSNQNTAADLALPTDGLKRFPLREFLEALQ